MKNLFKRIAIFTLCISLVVCDCTIPSLATEIPEGQIDLSEVETLDETVESSTNDSTIGIEEDTLGNVNDEQIPKKEIIENDSIEDEFYEEICEELVTVEEIDDSFGEEKLSANGSSVGSLLVVAAKSEFYARCKGNPESFQSWDLNALQSKNTYANEYSNGGGPWCDSFVRACFDRAGLPETIAPRGNSCQDIYNKAINIGAVVVTNPMPGDIILYTMGGLYGHIGIVAEDTRYSYQGNSANRWRYYQSQYYSDTNGNRCPITYLRLPDKAVNTNLDIISPTISDVVSQKNDDGYMIMCTVKDNVGISRVQFPTWTVAGGQDDLVQDWQNSDAVSGFNLPLTGRYTFQVKKSDHNNEGGTYITDIYAYDKSGNVSVCQRVSIDLDGPTKNVSTTKTNNDIDIWVTSNNNYDDPNGKAFVRTAAFYNPGGSAISEAGIVLLDSNKNVIQKGYCPQHDLDAFNKSGVKEFFLGVNSSGAMDNRYRIIYSLKPQTKYYYKFFIKNTAGGYKETAEYEVMTQGVAKPSAPVLSVDKQRVAAGESIKVSWNQVNNATGYNVTIQQVGGNYTKTNSCGVGTTSTSFGLPGAGTYRVSAYTTGIENSDVTTFANDIIAESDKTVIFVMENEEGQTVELDRKTVKYGSSVSTDAPTKTGYTFQGWDSSTERITADKTIKALFKKNKYTVTFYNTSGKEVQVLSRQSVEYKDSAILPENPTPEIGYVFAGWDSNEYECVTKNTSVYASFVWKDKDLPILLENASCEFDGDNGYWVTFDIKNYNESVTSGRAIVALKTNNGQLLVTTESSAFSLAKSQKKEKMEVFVPYSGIANNAEIVIVNSFAGEIPISKSMVVNATRDWSEWTTEKSNDPTEESRTEYSYRDKDYITSTASSIPGYVQYKSTYVVNNDGTWGAWQRTPIAATETRKVETRTVSDNNGYQRQVYYFYKNPNQLGFTPVKKQGYLYYEYEWRSNNGSSRPKPYKVCEGSMAYAFDVPNFSYGAYFAHELWWAKTSEETIPATTHTEYRCRDCSKTYTYYYYKWKDWSDYSADAVNATADREVRTRTTYRHKAVIMGESDVPGTERTISGTVDPEFAGRQAMLLVYKGDEPADYNNEFIGQIEIGEGGEYSFVYTTRENPSAKTGDFTIDLSIQGASSPIYLDTLAAPKPKYEVQFVDWDGTVISEQVVESGDSAVLPANPERENYVFTGWDSNITNVRDNMIISANYVEKNYAVSFVDWQQNHVSNYSYKYGKTLEMPIVDCPEGYRLVGWFDEAGNEVSELTVVSRDMVINAEYEIVKYTVNIYDYRGEKISSQIVPCGESADMGELPLKEGMVFKGWSTDEYTCVKSDLNLYPSFEYAETASVPNADVPSGNLNEITTVHLSAEEGAVIRYTTDGSEPTINSEIYNPSNGIVIDKNTILRYIALVDGKNISSEGISTYLFIEGEDEEGGLSIKKNTYSVELGEECAIAYFVSEGYTSDDVELYSMDSEVVKINENGTFSAVGIGNTQILALTADSKYGDYCSVEVFSSIIPVTQMTMEESLFTVEPGEEINPEVNVYPENATDKGYEWYSMDDAVVKVTDDGKMMAVNHGTTYLSAYSNSGNCKLSCYVAVIDPYVSIDENAISLKIGGERKLTAYSFGEITDPLIWYSDNSSVATVNDGVVTAVGPGCAEIHYGTQDGKYDAKVVAVVENKSVNIKETIEDSDVSVIQMVHFTGSELTPGVQVVHNGEKLLEDEDYLLVYSNNITVGKNAVVTVVGIGDYNGKIEKKFEIIPKDEPIVEGLKFDTIEPQIYTGSPIKPAVFVYDGEKLLVENKDYKLSYKNNTKISNSKNRPSVTITGIGDYSTSAKVEFEIVPKSIADDDITVTYDQYVASGKKSIPLPKIEYCGKNLKNKTDYIVTYIYENSSEEVTNVTAAGKAEMIIRGIGNFSGEIRKPFVVSAKPLLSTCNIKLSSNSIPYTGAAIEPSVMLTGKIDGVATLIPAEQYDVVYSNNIDCGTATVTLTAKDTSSFAGSIKTTFKITGMPISKAAVTGIENIVFDGSAKTQKAENIKVTYKKNKYEVVELVPYDELTGEGDYRLTYEKNVNVGTAKLVISGMNGYTGTLKKNFKIVPVSLATNNVKNDKINVHIASEAAYDVNGAKPEVVLTYSRDGMSDYILTEGVDYKVTFTNNKEAGYVGAVSIAGKGSFSGKLDKYATFTVKTKSIDDTSIVVNAMDIAFNKKTNNYYPKINITDGKKKLKEKTDFVIAEYTSNNVSEPGEMEYEVTLNGIGNYNGSIRRTYRVVSSCISNANVKLLTKYYFDGSEIEPEKDELSITVKVGSVNVVLSEDDYDIVSYSNNVKTGKASMVIRGKGIYGGEITVKYQILPRWIKRIVKG